MKPIRRIKNNPVLGKCVEVELKHWDSPEGDRKGAYVRLMGFGPLFLRDLSRC